MGTKFVRGVSLFSRNVPENSGQMVTVFDKLKWDKSVFQKYY